MDNVFVHDTAIVDAGAEIGADSKVWHFTHVMSGARIGMRCNLGQNVFVASGVTLGNSVKVQNNVSIYEGVEVEDDVFLGPSMVFTNVINPRSHINRRSEFKKTVVRSGATIGANATIVCGVEIGRYAMIGAGSVVTHDIPDYALVIGVPGRISGFVSEAGHRLEFDDAGKAVCPEDGSTYRKNGPSEVKRTV